MKVWQHTLSTGLISLFSLAHIGLLVQKKKNAVEFVKKEKKKEKKKELKKNSLPVVMMPMILFL